MSEDILFYEWRDENEQRNYPFADSALMRNATQAVPKTVFVDARLYPIGVAVPLYLSRVTVTPTQVEFAISATGQGELATAEMDIDSPPADGILAFSDSFGRPAGMMLASEGAALSLFSGWGTGTERFTADQLPLAANTIIPVPVNHVQSIQADDRAFAGDVWLCGEDGVVLRVEDDAVRVDIIGDPYATAQECRDQVVEGADCDPPAGQYNPVKTIRSVAPNLLGDWILAAGSLLFDDNPFKVTPQGSSLKIEIIGGRRSKVLE